MLNPNKRDEIEADLEAKIIKFVKERKMPFKGVRVGVYIDIEAPQTPLAFRGRYTIPYGVEGNEQSDYAWSEDEDGLYLNVSMASDTVKISSYSDCYAPSQIMQQLMNHVQEIQEYADSLISPHHTPQEPDSKVTGV